MTETPEAIEPLTPVLPERIVTCLNKISKRDKKVLPKTRLMLEFVLSKGERSCPDAETYKALYDILSETSLLTWHRQYIAMWASGRANLSEGRQKEIGLLLARRLDGVEATRRQWVLDNVDLGAKFATDWLVAITIVFLLLGVTMPLTYNSLLLISGVALVPLLLLPCTTWGYLKGARKYSRQEAARTLGLLGRAEGVPALLRASRNPGFSWEVGREALIRTLPSLQFEEHYGVLGSDVVPNLCHLLNRSGDYTWTSTGKWRLLLLGALEQVGDARAIEPLKRLTWDVANHLRDDPIVRERAWQVIEILKERVARETEQKTLLRGADAPVDPQTLLRSYEKPIETPPEQLLRAGQKKDE